MRRALAVVIAGVTLVVALAPSVYAASFSMTTPSVSGWNLGSTGSNTISGGSMTVGSLLSAGTVTVQADKSRMSEYNAGAYVSGGKTLGAALHVTAGTASTTGIGCSGPGSNVTVSTSAQTLATSAVGIACTYTWPLTLSQTTAITDPAVKPGRTYHIVLTYTLSGGLKPSHRP
jgi:hypothetical protein